jgi:hypothetical protein
VKTARHFVLILCLFLLSGCAYVTPLMDASGERGDLGAVKKLVDKGADVNERGPYGGTALSSAAYYGHAEIVVYLLDRGASVKGANGAEALINAARQNHLVIVKLLIEKGVPINARRNSDAETALSAAAFSGNREVVQFLIDNGADIDEAIEYSEKQAVHLKTILPEYATKYSIGASTLKKLSGMQRPPVRSPGRPDGTAASDVDRPSYRMPDNPDNFAIVVGIEQYSDLPEALYAERDALAVKEHLVALGFPSRNIILITGQKATRTSISKNVETWLPNNITRNSSVFFYYSGHGAPEPSTGEAYIVPFDGDPNYLVDTGYALSRLYQKLGSLPAKKVVIVLDSCFSGAGGKSVLAKGARPLVMIPSPISLSSNMTVLSATQGNQISTSSGDKRHGLLTYYYLQALNKGNAGMDDIYNYLKPRVEDEARSLNVSQSPSLQHGR